MGRLAEADEHVVRNYLVMVKKVDVQVESNKNDDAHRDMKKDEDLPTGQRCSKLATFRAHLVVPPAYLSY